MKKTQAKLKQYQDAIDASNIVSKTDINGIITFVNDEFCKISGYSR
ncbi:MAG: PAS domain S-box protein, partial [Campylobacter sp.]|nr:PAS domain S-box protein [Campylobacter sp.]